MQSLGFELTIAAIEQSQTYVLRPHTLCSLTVWKNCTKSWPERLWDSLSELRISLCERRLESTVLRRALFACQNCSVYKVFPSGMTSHSEIAQCNWECMAPFRPHVHRDRHPTAVLRSNETFSFTSMEPRGCTVYKFGSVCTLDRIVT